MKKIIVFHICFMEKMFPTTEPKKNKCPRYSQQNKQVYLMEQVNNLHRMVS